MEKKKKHRVNDAVIETAKKISMKDSFQNTLARLGFAMPNVTEGAKYPLTRLTRNYNLMTALYRNSWIIRRVIDTVAKDMIKNWVEFTSGITPEETDLMNRAIRKYGIKAKLIEALIWARLYGGSAALIILEGEDDLSQPLELDKIMPGQFKGLIVLDRWSGIYPQLENIKDIDDPDFGLPEYYVISSDETIEKGVKVHHSRILRFVGDLLPLWEKEAESYWGASIVERLFEELKKRDNTSANIASLVFLSCLRVLKMQDYGQVLSLNNQKAQKSLYDTIQAQNILMNNMGMYILDKDDDFQVFQQSFSGLDDVYEKFMLDIAGAANIPATRLYGRSPAGMNSTGEGEETNYNNDIEQEQENSLRFQLDKLFPIIAMSTLGYLPDDLDFNFNPVETLSQKEIAERIYRSTEAVRGAYTDGIISQQIAMKELKHLGKRLGVFTNITDEDIDMASNELQSPEDNMMEAMNEGPMEVQEERTE